MGKIAIKTNATADISSILPEVFRFYDATATSTITLASGTNNITSWGDRSVNNIAAIQTVGSQQPIYNPATGTGLRTISTFNARSFLINMGNLAFDGWLYAADAINGVFKFYLKTPSSQTDNILKFWAETSAISVGFNNLIGIVIISNNFNQRHENNIVNYFGVRSQNLKHLNDTNIYFNYGTSTSLLAPAFGSQIISFPLINTNNTIDMSFTWYGVRNLTSFPLINTQKIINMQQSWFACASLSSFPPIDTQNVTNMTSTWDLGSSLTSFPAINTVKITTFIQTWSGCPLSQLSIDNIIISIAAGWINNPNKSISNVSGIFGSGIPISNINRRPETDLNQTNTQDTISDWNTIIDSYLSTGLTLDQMRTQHANAIDTYNTKWKSWEQALRSTNESLNGVQYNFSNGTVSGQKAYYWMLAKKNREITLGSLPPVPNNTIRIYRTSSGMNVTNNNVTYWATAFPSSGQNSSQQTISGLTTQTINGITCVMFSSNTKTITLNSINVGTGHRVYIGTLYGYVKITPPTATNLKISTNSTIELPIISIMVTTTAVNETEVLLLLGYFGSFQEFNYTANGLTSNNIQLTAV